MNQKHFGGIGMSVKHNHIDKSRQTSCLGLAKRRLGLLLLVASAVVPFTGCSAFTGLNNSWKYNGYWNQTMMGHRNKVSATKAWHCRKHHFCNEKYLREFSQGFKAGYMEVADGGTGCTPAFPPREYWGWKYQSCEGQARVAAWYAGYPHGARAAEEEGIGNWTQIQTSSGIQQQYAQHGLLNASSSGMYPIAQTAVPTGRPEPTPTTAQSYPIEAIDDVRGMPISVQQGPAEIIHSPQFINQ
jgi:hypothetical protein